VALLRAMARRDDGEAAARRGSRLSIAPIPWRAKLCSIRRLPLADALPERDRVYGIAADAALFGRLDLATVIV